MTQLSGAAWAPSDDDGTGQSGTAINLAWVDAIEASINALIHSAANPTVTPEDIIDEVVAGRGGEVSLDARFDAILTDLTDGTWIGANLLLSSGWGIDFRSTNVTHGMTGLANTNLYGNLQIHAGASGGMDINGLTDADVIAMQIQGIIGVAAPTASPIDIVGSKKNGLVNGALASTEIVMRFLNYGTVLGTFYGDGLNIVNGLSVGFVDVPSADEIRLGDATFKLDYVGATEVRLQFDTNDYIVYDRTANTFGVYIGGVFSFLATASKCESENDFICDSLVVGPFMAGAPQGVIGFGEIADPAAPAGDSAYLYCRDNGAAKTQIVARFPTGAVVVIATEP